MLAEAEQAGVRAVLLGETGGDSIALAGEDGTAVIALKSAHESWFPTFMGSCELPPAN
jgi:phosphoribosylformylglycinamidine synthase